MRWEGLSELPKIGNMQAFAVNGHKALFFPECEGLGNGYACMTDVLPEVFHADVDLFFSVRDVANAL